MAGRKKFSPRKLKSPKRDVGVNPAALLGGAAAGAAVGAKLGGARGRAGLRSRLVDATRQAKIDYDYSGNRGVILDKETAWGGKPINKAATAVSRLATSEAKKYNYKSRSYKNIVGANAEIRSGRDKFSQRMATANARGAMRDAAGSRGARRGAAIGGLSGAAISALAQAVARELRKKR
jgi:hypothetical protein